MDVDIEQIFLVQKREICTSLFPEQGVDALSRWQHLYALAGADQPTFWTLCCHSHAFPKALVQCIDDADRSHVSSTERVSAANQDALAEVISRIIVGLAPLSSTSGKVPTYTSFAQLLSKLIPPRVLLATALLMQRRSPTHGSVVITALFLQCPHHLASIKSTFYTWADNILALASNAVEQLKRGRFERTATDFLKLIEESYRQVKQIWGIFHSCPFIVEYLPVDKILISFRIIVDTIAPVLQHCLMVCDSIAVRRPQLSKAVATIANAAVDSATILLLFSRYPSGLSGRDEYLLSKVVQDVDETLLEYLLRYSCGFAKQLCSRADTHSIRELLLEVVKTEGTQKCRLGPLLLSTLQTDKKYPSAPGNVFGVQLLGNLVKQGVELDDLASRKFLLSDEVRSLGGGDNSVSLANDQATTANTEGDAHKRKIAPPPGDSSDPMVLMVAEVLPQLSPPVIEKAIVYYSNDVERLINDAMSGNLPPHLLESSPPAQHQHQDPNSSSGILPPTPFAPNYSSNILAGNFSSSHEQQADYGQDIYQLLNSDLVDGEMTSPPSGPNTRTGEGGGMFPATSLKSNELMTFTRSSDLFEMDDELKERIVQFSEQGGIYNDERDDGQEYYNGGTAAVNREVGESSSDDDDDDEPDTTTTGATTTTTSSSSQQGAKRKIPRGPFSKTRVFIPDDDDDDDEEPNEGVGRKAVSSQQRQNQQQRQQNSSKKASNTQTVVIKPAQDPKGNASKRTDQKQPGGAEVPRYAQKSATKKVKQHLHEKGRNVNKKPRNTE